MEWSKFYLLIVSEYYLQKYIYLQVFLESHYKIKFYLVFHSYSDKGRQTSFYIWEIY